MNEDRHLTLVLPDLAFRSKSAPTRDVVLERFLSRAQRLPQAAKELDCLLPELFGCHDGPDGLAALSVLGEGIDPGRDFWLRADPVQLEADHARVYILGNRHLSLSGAEVDGLLADVQPLLRDRGWKLIAPHPRRWYLRLQEEPGIEAPALEAVLGAALDTCPPGGANLRLWQTLTTEIQMVLHDSPVNNNRHALNQPPVNSLWFSGGGALPGPGSGVEWTRVWSDLPLARGLGRLHGALVEDAPADGVTWLATAPPGRHLVAFDVDGASAAPVRAHPPGAGCDAWIRPLQAALASGRLASLRLLPGGGLQFHLTKRLLKRWWRRARPLADYTG